jgi:hypothetical protein
VLKQLGARYLRRGLAVIVGGCGCMALSACCGYFSYTCAPQQPASITANENVESFTSARDQAEGLLAASHNVFTDATVAGLTPRYTAAAGAANAWIDYAQGALRSQGSFDAGQSTHRLDDVLAAVAAFTDAVEAAAAVPANFKAPFTPLPSSAVLDDLTAGPPIVAAAKQVRNGVGGGIDAILAAEGAISALDQTDRSRIADTLASVKWQTAQDVLAAPVVVSPMNS